ncbi:MAG TPA: hypothetical protein VEV17_05820 [Bryobacteraceae bacterium]|nr:hypothetical protein [Bryobacteraceae bacterium]
MHTRIVLLVFVSCAIVLGAAAPVGVLTAVGSIRVDGADVRGNGTVRNGSVIETIQNPSHLSLKNGSRLDLAAESRAQVYGDHAVLERGASQIQASSRYPIQVNSLSVIAVGPSSTIRVFRTGASKLEVSAVTGQAEVRGAGGVMIARVFPGSALDFDQQPAGAAGATKVSGRLEKQDGRYKLTDVTTRVRFELQGDNLEKSVGQCITATGSSDPSTAELIHLATYSKVSCKKIGLPLSAAAAGAGAGAGTAGAAGAAAAGGLSTAAIAGIAVGGAAAAGLGSAAAAGAFSRGQSTSVSAP